MRKSDYLKELKHELGVRGIYGKEYERLEEQIEDHYRSAIEEQLAAGESLEKIEDEVGNSLGSPEKVATATLEEIRSRHLLTCHPWTIAGGGVFLSLLIFQILLFFLVVILFHSSELRESVFQGLLFIFNWLPFFIGYLWLLKTIRESIGSWKALVIASLALGVATSFFSFGGNAPAHGPGSGSLTIALTVISDWLRGEHLSPVMILKPALLIKLLLPILTVILFRGSMIETPKREME